MFEPSCCCSGLSTSRTPQKKTDSATTKSSYSYDTVDGGPCFDIVVPPVSFTEGYTPLPNTKSSDNSFSRVETQEPVPVYNILNPAQMELKEDQESAEALFQKPLPTLLEDVKALCVLGREDDLTIFAAESFRILDSSDNSNLKKKVTQCMTELLNDHNSSEYCAARVLLSDKQNRFKLAQHNIKLSDAAILTLYDAGDTELLKDYIQDLLSQIWTVKTPKEIDKKQQLITDILCTERAGTYPLVNLLTDSKFLEDLTINHIYLPGAVTTRIETNKRHYLFHVSSYEALINNIEHSNPMTYYSHPVL